MKRLAERVIAIGEEMATLQLEIGQNAAELAEQRAGLAARESYLLAEYPPQGRNADERTVARETTLRADSRWGGYFGFVQRLEQRRTVLDARVSALSAERRGLEWAIRCAMLDRSVADVYGDGQPGSDRAEIDDRYFDVYWANGEEEMHELSVDDLYGPPGDA